MPVAEYTINTDITDSSQLVFPDISGLLLGGFAYTPVVVPLTLTSYAPATRNAKVNEVGVLPIITPDNMAYSANTLLLGGTELPKITFEGFMDTPTVDFNGWQLPELTLNEIRYTYADLIAMYVEGRAAQTPTGYGRVDPLSFRDPYGRVYDNPRILDFSASYVESVPGRNNFSMTLKV